MWLDVLEQLAVVLAGAEVEGFLCVCVEERDGHAALLRVLVVEAVQLAGDVVLLEDLEAHGAEGVVQVVAHLGDGMQAAAEGHGARYGDVEVGIHLGELQPETLGSPLHYRRL